VASSADRDSLTQDSRSLVPAVLRIGSFGQGARGLLVGRSTFLPAMLQCQLFTAWLTRLRGDSRLTTYGR
jgi:hypothetical protein